MNDEIYRRAQEFFARSPSRGELRDYWLRQAYAAIGGQADIDAWHAFESEVRSFGAWKFEAWRKLGGAPAYATQLERCLFLAFVQDTGNKSIKKFPDAVDIVSSPTDGI